MSSIDRRRLVGRSRLSRRRVLGLGAGAGAAAFLVACGGSGDESGGTVAEATREAGVVSGGQDTGEAPRPGGSLSVAWPLTPPLDPVANSTYTAQRLASFVYPRLLKFKTDADPRTAQAYEIIPDMAAAMPEVLDDGRRYVFTLRPNVIGHAKPPLNGRPYDAEDVKASFERFIAEPRNPNRGAFASAGVEGVETPDQNTVVFRLARPFAPFLTMIAAPQYLWVMPKEAGNGFDPARDMAGAGPFVFESLEPDIAIRFRKHPDFYDAPKPYVDSFTLPIVTDSPSRFAQFQAERLDIGEPSYENVLDLQSSNPDATVIKFPSTTFPLVYTQQRGNSVFRDPRIRQALSLAIDRDALLALTYGGEGWWQNIVPVNMGRWWTDPKDPASRPSTRWFGTGDRDQDLAEAVSLLEAAGYNERRKLDFKYHFTNNGYGDTHNQWAEATQGFLKETGIFEPSVTIADYRSEWLGGPNLWYGGIPENSVGFGLMTIFSDPHDYVYNMLHSASPRNQIGLQDPQMDALVEKEVATLGQEERMTVIKEIVARANDQALYAPVMIGPAHFALQPWVKGFTLSITYGWATESFMNTFVTR
ncbi:MAG: ABC transporter substrate-binding protein [Dehalococcoidia bacterium]